MVELILIYYFQTKQKWKNNREHVSTFLWLKPKQPFSQDISSAIRSPKEDLYRQNKYHLKHY